MEKVLIALVMICLLLAQVAWAKDSRSPAQLKADMDAYLDFENKINAASKVAEKCRNEKINTAMKVTQKCSADFTINSARGVAATVQIYNECMKGTDAREIFNECSRASGFDELIRQRNAWKVRCPSPAIGMNADEAMFTNWGQGYEVHKTTTAHGVDEQWVFGGDHPRSLCFHNGILTTIQE